MTGPAGDPVGRFYGWRRGDPLPALPPVPGLAVAPTGDDRLLAGLTGADIRDIRERVQRGNRPWLARIAGEPVGWGWIARREVAIPAVGAEVVLPPGERYLWDFVTLPAWRGRGVYPRLLQAILAAEAGAERFWVGHDQANTASARGIAKAGFVEVGTVHRLPSSNLIFVASGPPDRSAAAAALLGLPLR